MKLYIDFDIYGTKFCNWIILFVSRFWGHFLISVTKFFSFSVMIFDLFLKRCQINRNARPLSLKLLSNIKGAEKSKNHDTEGKKLSH